MEYEVTVVFPGQGVSRLQVTADSPEAVAAAPALRGGVVVAQRALAERRGRRGPFPLALFTRQLLSLLQAGLTDHGVGGTVVAHFHSGAEIDFAGIGTGHIDSFADLVAHSNQLLLV